MSLAHESSNSNVTLTSDKLESGAPKVDGKPVLRLPNRIPVAAWVVIMFGSLERMAFYGGSTPCKRLTRFYMTMLIGPQSKIISSAAAPRVTPPAD